MREETHQEMRSLASNHSCRFCETQLQQIFVDLGSSPFCQTQITLEQLKKKEPYYPLRTYVCGNCFLVQTDENVEPDVIFSSEYPYYSSYSDSWVKHAKSHVDTVKKLYGIDANSFVVEVASNDGYLLQHCVNDGIPCLGIEPAAGVAEAAKKKGVCTLQKFFGTKTAADIVSQYGQADLIIGNNVLAHVPEINDFVRGLWVLLKPNGKITMEFPHLLRLMQENQFDTIYHEHYSYFSFYTVNKIFNRHRLRIFNVEQLPTHGGSLRIHACASGNLECPTSDRAKTLLKEEIDLGINHLEFYQGFDKQVKDTKRALLNFLHQAKQEHKSVVGYGAPGKGNTLLNYCDIGPDSLEYTVDRNPHKQGTYTPGTHIPIYDPEHIGETHPDYVLILPWNLKKEIMNSMSEVREWGGKFVVPIPTVKVLD